MTREVETFLAEAEIKMHEHELRDVYITNHKAKAAKFVTLSADEDIENKAKNNAKGYFILILLQPQIYYKTELLSFSYANKKMPHKL